MIKVLEENYGTKPNEKHKNQWILLMRNRNGNKNNSKMRRGIVLFKANNTL